MRETEASREINLKPNILCLQEENPINMPMVLAKTHLPGREYGFLPGGVKPMCQCEPHTRS